MGLAAAFYFQPGAGMNVDPKALDASAMSAYATNADKLTRQPGISALNFDHPG